MEAITHTMELDSTEWVQVRRPHRDGHSPPVPPVTPEPLQLRAVDWDVPVQAVGNLRPGITGVALATAAEAPALLLLLTGTSARAAIVTLRPIQGQAGGMPAVIPFSRWQCLLPGRCIVYSLGPEQVCPRLAAGQVKRVPSIELVVEVDERWANEPWVFFQEGGARGLRRRLEQRIAPADILDCYAAASHGVLLGHRVMRAVVHEFAALVGAP